MTINTLLQDINFSNLVPVTKKCITYAADGNTLIRPYKKLYSLWSFCTTDSDIKSIYLEPVKTLYGDTQIKIWEDYGPLCYCIGKSAENISICFLIMQLKKYGIGKEQFINRLSNAEKVNAFIRKEEIEVLTSLGERELAAHYQSYHAAYMDSLQKKEEAERLARLKAEQLAQANAEIKREEIISQAIKNIQQKKPVENVEVDGKSLFLLLAKKYGIYIPIKTQGWIKRKLAMVEFTSEGTPSYRFYGSSQKDNSTVFLNYLLELVDAINN